MTQTPRTNRIAHHGYDETAYIAEMTNLSRDLELELATAHADLYKVADALATANAEIARLKALNPDGVSLLKLKATNAALVTDLHNEMNRNERTEFAQACAKLNEQLR